MFDFFSIYANSFEKEIDLYLSKLNEKSDKNAIKSKVLEFIKKDLITFNLWIERKYKGYNYLERKKRQEFLAKLKIFEQDLDRYLDLIKTNFGIYENSEFKSELNYLEKISIFLKEEYSYKYQESSNFGELFKFLSEKKIVGDCNQIVTLYIYLYGKKYDISRLNLRIFKNHVCLHLGGFDLEATSGEILKYTNQDSRLVDVTEIISINLLDITDPRETKYSITAENILEASKLAFLLSSERDLTESNLRASVMNLAIKYLKNSSPKRALELSLNSLKGDNQELIIRNIINYYIEKEDFDNALKVVRHSSSREELSKKVKKGLSISLYNKNQLEKALEVAKEIGDLSLAKDCYWKMYSLLQEKIKDIKTIKELRTKKNTILEMNKIASRSNDPDLLKSAKALKTILNS